MQDILSEIEELQKYILVLGRLEEYTTDEFTSDTILYLAAERCIVVSMNTICRIACQITQECKFTQGTNFAQNMDILVRNKVIPKFVAESLKEKEKYIKISKGKDVLQFESKEKLKEEIVQECLNDFRHFRKYVCEYVV